MKNLTTYYVAHTGGGRIILKSRPLNLRIGIASFWLISHHWHYESGKHMRMLVNTQDGQIDLDIPYNTPLANTLFRFIHCGDLIDPLFLILLNIPATRAATHYIIAQASQETTR